MKKLTVSEDSSRDRLKLFFHLIPVVGFFPSLWTLYRHEGAEERRSGGTGEQLLTTNARLPTTHAQTERLAISRLSITLALSWLLAYILLGVGAETSEFLHFRLLMLNSLLTSGYFLVSLWLMLRLATGKSVRLPGFSVLARAIGKR
jgi:hypothetical protein